MLKEAKKKGLTVSFDGNFRSTLWTWDEARDFCTECLLCGRAAGHRAYTCGRTRATTPRFAVTRPHT